MAKKGKLKMERLGYSGPQNAPLFQKPPYYYQGVESITVYYETDEEAALELLPEDLELYTPATVRLSVFRAPFTTLGGYSAALVVLHCLWQGQPKAFVCYQIVTGDAAMAAGACAQAARQSAQQAIARRTSGLDDGSFIEAARR